ncbi:MAG: hypothetical protein GX868_02415, partial [Actinobacteria bacterium]|nr:hypothetical protein [Actinomycetota bacterium]
MSFGIMVLLILLMTAAHILLNLWTLSVLDAAAYDAASDVAVALGDGADRAALEARARERALAALGGYGERVRFEFADLDGPDGLNGRRGVAVVASGPSLSLVPAPLAASLGLEQQQGE